MKFKLAMATILFSVLLMVFPPNQPQPYTLNILLTNGETRAVTYDEVNWHYYKDESVVVPAQTCAWFGRRDFYFDGGGVKFQVETQRVDAFFYQLHIVFVKNGFQAPLQLTITEEMEAFWVADADCRINLP